MPEVISIGGKTIAWQEINDRRFGPRQPSLRYSAAELIKDNLDRNFHLIYGATNTDPHPNLLSVEAYFSEGSSPANVEPQNGIDWRGFRPDQDFRESPVICHPYLRAPTLKSYFDTNTTLGLGEYELVDYFSRLCMGCHHLHQHGLVHRDIHPGNVLVKHYETTEMLGQDPKDLALEAVNYHIELSPKNFPQDVIPQDLVLMDYDLTGKAGKGDGIWHSHIFTPYYASPEQMQASGRSQPTTDIFSLGMLFAHLYFNEFAGRPFPDLNTSRPVTSELYRQFDTIPFFRRDIKEAIEGATLYDSNYRYQDIPTFLADLKSAF